MPYNIGPDIDVPAGDIGVGGREIGYLFGQYRRLKGSFENGVLTGKGETYGGSLIRPEATGFGAVYYLTEVLNHENDTIAGKTIAISGFGNVSWAVCRKATELGRQGHHSLRPRRLYLRSRRRQYTGEV